MGAGKEVFDGVMAAGIDGRGVGAAVGLTAGLGLVMAALDCRVRSERKTPRIPRRPRRGHR